MKYLSCICCGFLAAIPPKDSHAGLVCPFCVRMECDSGSFEEITVEKFKQEAEL